MEITVMKNKKNKKIAVYYYLLCETKEKMFVNDIHMLIDING